MRLPDHVYHLAEAANWPSIQRHGLRSASALMESAGLVGDDRDLLDRQQRLHHVRLPGGVFVRDQRPMPPPALERCLVGMSPAEWYALINSRVFFWFDPDRLNRQRRACGSRAQVVLIVDAAALLAVYGGRAALTPFNTGNARRQPAKRGAATFVPFFSWQESGWAREAVGLGTRPRSRSHRPVELTIAVPVPDILRFVVRVQELAPGESFVAGTR